MTGLRLNRQYLSFLTAVLMVVAVGGFAVVRLHRADSSWLAAGSDSWRIGQEDQESETEEVAPEQIEKYVKVYTAMQRDRTLTVDQAAAREHLTVPAFRDIESKIERDGMLRDRVRRELLKSAEEKTKALKIKPSGASSSSPSAP